jgi:hypothetical protein
VLREDFLWDVFVCGTSSDTGRFECASSILAILISLAHAEYSNVGCPRYNQIIFSVRTETNRNSICFGCFSVCFAKPKNIFFGLIRCFGPASKQPKQTEFSRNKPKKSLNNRNKRLVSNSAETSFGSSFSCFDTKLVSQDTLLKRQEFQSTCFKL